MLGILLYCELYFMFRHELKRRMITDDDNQVNDWTDLVQLPQYAAFCSFRLLLACIGIPIVGQIQSSYPSMKDYPLDMCVVLGLAVLSLIVDFLAFDIRRLANVDSTSISAEHEEPLIHHALAIPEEQSMDTGDIELSGIGTLNSSVNEIKELKDLNMNATMDTRVTHDTFETYDSNQLLFDKLKLKVESFAVDALWELPWKLIPFVFGLFIIVGYMDEIGLVSFLADSLVQIAESQGDSIWIPMFLVGVTATFLCQVVNNQPMTVLMATVLERIGESYKEGEVIPDWLNGCYFALAIGANLGGNSTPIASLAVMMWKGILSNWNIQIKYIGFSKRGIAITPLLVLVCIAIVAVQSQYFFN